MKNPKAAKAPHRPTKLCPHRWCRRAHMAYLILSMTGAAMLGLPGPVVAIAILLVTVPITGAAVSYLFAKDPTMAAPVSTVLQVNRKWTNAALAVDLGIILFAAYSVFDTAAHMDEHVPDAVVLARIGSPRTLVMAAVIGLWIYTHRRATRPGKPRRVRMRRLVPALAKSS